VDGVDGMDGVDGVDGVVGVDGDNHTAVVFHPDAWSAMKFRSRSNWTQWCRKCQHFDTDMTRFAQYNKNERLLAENVGIERVSSW
jgi:hypothetical protein